MTITEKVAYLKGLAEGLAIDTDKSKEGKLIASIIDILEEVGLSIEDLEENSLALGEEIDALSDDLSDVEEVIFEEDDDDDCDCGCDCDCDDEDFFEVQCPNCGADLDIDEDVLESGTIQCPACHQKFALDLYDDDDECGCGCGCDCDDDKVVDITEPPKADKKPAKKADKKPAKKADKKTK
ncbi:MAG: hypothetical protein RR450_06780 [Oscillospiraceae bacterium]